MTLIQVAVVTTSLMSLCLGFVTWRQHTEMITYNKAWIWVGMTVDMVWNILFISPRVIALALFA